MNEQQVMNGMDHPVDGDYEDDTDQPMTMTDSLPSPPPPPPPPASSTTTTTTTTTTTAVATTTSTSSSGEGTALLDQAAVWKRQMESLRDDIYIWRLQNVIVWNNLTMLVTDLDDDEGE